MRWSYTIGRIAGTEVKVHVTFLLLLAYIGYTAFRAAGAEAAVYDTLFFVCFFLCILLHEFGHIRMASRFGVRTPDVILLPIERETIQLWYRHLHSKLAPVDLRLDVSDDALVLRHQGSILEDPSRFIVDFFAQCLDAR